MACIDQNLESSTQKVGKFGVEVLHPVLSCMIKSTITLTIDDTISTSSAMLS